MPADVEIVAADASGARQAIEAARGAAVVYQALNPPYDKWKERFPPLQQAAIESAFGLTPTPIEEGLKRTVAWWREARATAAA